MSGSNNRIHGDDLLYRFFLRLEKEQPDVFAVVTKLFLESTAVWLPRELYEKMPVLLPWVVRDNSCRPSPSQGLPEAWGSPNADGYLRDDNSLVKIVPRSLTIRGPRDSGLNGKRLGTEFVASHIWRKIAKNETSNRVPLLNTFVPNLVWLPSQISKLSDIEGGVVQETLKAMTRQIYGSVPVVEPLESVVSDAWSQLPAPTPAREIQVDLSKLNWFVTTDEFIVGRINRLRVVIDALEKIDRGDQPTKKIITTRYTEGLPGVGGEARKRLLEFLRRFLS